MTLSKGVKQMKAYFRWYNHNYRVINPDTKSARYYIGAFKQKATPAGVSLYDCYEYPSRMKQNAYRALNDMFSYVTITRYNTFHFTAMSTLEGLKALFIDTSVNCYVVADRNDLKQFADALHVGFCEYREEK